MIDGNDVWLPDVGHTKLQAIALKIIWSSAFMGPPRLSSKLDLEDLTIHTAAPLSYIRSIFALVFLFTRLDLS